MAATDYRGIWPILYAFFTPDGRLDEAAMRRQVDYCVANGAHGIAVLGLVTEVHKMDVNERLHLVECVGDAIDGRAPYAVTIGEPSLEGQIRFARAARDAGADWVILQPPTSKGASQSALLEFFGTVAERVDIDVAVQNNPVNLDVSLSVASLVELNRRHPNITLLKGEGNAVDIASVIDGSEGRYRVFGGHGGIEFPALLRAGGAGLIPAPDFLAAQVRLFELWERGEEAARAEAERLHREILPAIVFMSRSVPGMLCYGKRLFARQAGMELGAERAPALAPTAFGLDEIERFEREIAGAIAAATENTT